MVKDAEKCCDHGTLPSLINFEKTLFQKEARDQMLNYQSCPSLVKFFKMLDLPFLNQPEIEHAIQFVDTLIAHEGTSSVSELNRLSGHPTRAESLCDFFSQSPWQPDEMWRQLRQWLFTVLSHLGEKLSATPVYVAIDDVSLVKPKDSRHFEFCGWHKDYKNGGYFWGVVVVTIRVRIGPFEAVLGAVPYLREKTIRAANRKRKEEHRPLLAFQTKCDMAADLLRAIAADLKKLHRRIYVLFDSWYASAPFMRIIRRHGFHYICSLRSNRELDGVKVSALNAAARRNREGTRRITLETSSGQTPYYVLSREGRLNGVPGKVKVDISRRHPRSRSAEYFVTSDLSLSPHEMLKGYQNRWPVEVDYLYAKMRLGLEKFRVRGMESFEKWVILVFLALNYLYWKRAMLRKKKPIILADIIRLHQNDFHQREMNEVCKLAVRYHSSRKGIQHYLQRQKAA